MSTRLPTPGGDDGQWGDILNDFLSVEHDANGALKARTDGTLAPLSGGKLPTANLPAPIPTANLGAGTASSSNFLRGDGTWAVPTSSGAQALVATGIKTGAYSAGVGELIPVDATTAAVTITLPTAPVDKTRVAVKKIDGSSHTVTISAAGSDTFNKSDGATNLTLSVQNQSLNLQYAVSGNIWYVVGDDLPLSQLDTRYLRTISPSGDITGATDSAVIAAALAASSGIIMSAGNWWINQPIKPSTGQTVMLVGPIIVECADQANCQVITNSTWAVRGSATAQSNISIIGIGDVRLYGYHGASLTADAASGSTSLQLDTLIAAGSYTVDALGSSNKESVVITNPNSTNATSAPYTATLASAIAITHVSGKGVINQSFVSSFNAAQVMTFVGVTGLLIEGLSDIRGMYSALSMFGCANVKVRRIRWNHTLQPGHGADGIDLGPDSNNVYIEDVGGYATDDSFSFFAQRSAGMIPSVYTTAMGSPSSSLTSILPNITDVTVRNADCDSGGANIFRLQCGDQGVFQRMHAYGITNRSISTVVLTLGESTYVNTAATLANFSDVVFDGVYSRASLVRACMNISSLTFRNVVIPNGGGSFITTPTSFAPSMTDVVFENIHHDCYNSNTGNSISTFANFRASSTITGLTFRNITCTRAENILSNAGTVTGLDIKNVHLMVAGNILFTSTTAETGSIDGLQIETYGGSATALFNGAALKLKLGPNMPVFTSTDTALSSSTSAATKGSRVICDNTRQADGGTGTTAAEWVANGTSWIKAVDLGSMTGR